MIPLQLPGGVSRALLLPVGSTFLLSSLPFCTPSRALSPPTSSPGRSPAEGAGQTPRQRTPAPGGGHLQFGVKVTELLVDPDIAVPALQPGLGPLILAAETPGLPVTGRRGDLPVLQDDGWARAPERHGRSGRTEGQGMEGRTTPGGSPGHSPVLPSRFPHVSCSRVTQPFLSRVQSLRWVWKLQGPPLTKDRLCGRPPGEITAGGGTGRNPLPPRLWAVTAQSQAPEGAPGREPVSSYNSCLAPVEPVTRWPVLLGLHLGQRTRDALHLAVLLTQGRPQCSQSALQRWGPGAWGVDGRGGSLSSPTSQSLKSPTQPEASPGQQGQLFFWGLSFLQSNCLC